MIDVREALAALLLGMVTVASAGYIAKKPGSDIDFTPLLTTDDQSGLLPAASPPVGTPEDADSWLESEWRNILQAAQYASRHGWKATCADLAHVLADFMEIKGYWEEA